MSAGGMALLAALAANDARRAYKSRRGGGKKPAYAGKARTASRTQLVNRRRRRFVGKKYAKVGGVATNSRFALARRPNRQVQTMKRIGAPSYYNTNGANQIVAQEGFQEASVVAWQGFEDLSYMLNLVPIQGGSTVGFQAPKRYILEETVGELMFTNSSLATCFLEIFDVVRKRDNFRADNIQNQATANPLLSWRQGIQDNQVTGTNDYHDLKTSPTDSRIFRDWFKIVRKTRVELRQGALHRHSVLLKPNRVVDSEMINYVGGDAAGFSTYTLFRVYGQPASVINPEGPSIVTTAQIALDYVSSVKYKFSWVSDTTQNQYIVDNLQSLKGEQVVSMGAGQIVPNAIV